MEASIYRLRSRDLLTLCVLALLALGTVMVQSASTSLSGAIVRAPAPDPAGPRETSPARPVNVTAAASADGIDLSWSPDRDSAIVSYQIYRGASEAGPFELLETLRKPRSRYHDSQAPEGDGSVYRVTALDENGVESAPTELTVIRPGLWRWTTLGSKQLLYVALAAGVYFVIGRIDYRRLARFDSPIVLSPVFWLLLIATLACIAVLIPGIGTAINGARRWIKLGPVQIQPSELAKWAAVVFTAWWLTRPRTDVQKFLGGFLPVIAAVGMLCLLVVIQDFGTAALIGLCILTMLLAGRVKLWHVGLILVPAVAGAVWFILDKEYRLRRIMAFRDPYASPQGEGYHMIQSLLSFTTGGITGRGLGNGVQKLGYLPEDTTDFIFAVICEELGLGGALLVVSLYLGILMVAWQTMRRRRDDFGNLLAFGIASMVGLQAAINIAVATVSVPTKGLSLPLISAGGSGMVITCAALGLLYSVTRHATARGCGMTALSRGGVGQVPPTTDGHRATPSRNHPATFPTAGLSPAEPVPFSVQHG